MKMLQMLQTNPMFLISCSFPGVPVALSVDLTCLRVSKYTNKKKDVQASRSGSNFTVADTVLSQSQLVFLLHCCRRNRLQAGVAGHTFLPPQSSSSLVLCSGTLYFCPGREASRPFSCMFIFGTSRDLATQAMPD